MGWGGAPIYGRGELNQTSCEGFWDEEFYTFGKGGGYSGKRIHIKILRT